MIARIAPCRVALFGHPCYPPYRGIMVDWTGAVRLRHIFMAIGFGRLQWANWIRVLPGTPQAP